MALSFMLAMPETGMAQSSTDAAVTAQLPVNHYEYLMIPGIQARLYEKSDTLSVNVVFEGTEKTLELHKYSNRDKQFEILVQTGPDTYESITAPDVNTYRGIISGETGSQVTASLSPKGLSATVRGKGTTWQIEPASEFDPTADTALHVVYKQSAVEASTFSCGIDDHTEARFNPFKGLIEDPIFKSTTPATGSALTCYKVCQIAIDADYEYFVAKGSDTTAVTAAIEEIINDVALIYERDCGITYSITTIIIRQAASDPYTATAADALLDEMVAYWNSNHNAVTRDIAHLFTGREIDGSTIGIAYIGVICNGSFGYGLSQNISGRSSRAGLTAHELGHNWNATHCSGEDCRIMCPGLGGCTGDVSQFGAASVALIEAHRDSRACLSEECPGNGPAFTSNPISKPDAYHNANYAQSLAGDVNDIDSSPAQLTFSKLSGPTWLNVAANGGLSGTPGGFAVGSNSFSVQVMDNTGLTDVATLNINVLLGRSAPTAYNDSASTDENTPVIINVLVNDNETDGDTLQILSVTQPTHGEVVINANQTVTYTPDTDFVGIDVFSYVVTDNAEGQDSADVSVTVNGTGAAPVAVPDWVFVDQNGSLLIYPLENDTDADDDPLDLISITQPDHGTAVLNPDDSVLYTPDPDYLGQDAFTYVISDNRDGQGNSWVGMDVRVPRSIPTANPDFATTDEGQPVTINVKGNDSDADDDGIDVISVTQPANGYADLRPDDTIIYTPDEFFVGQDTFQYVLTDAIDGNTTGTVTVTVNNTGSAPVANSDTEAVTRNQAIIIDVLSNDTDGEDDPIEITAVTQPANGTTEITDDQRIRYIPAPAFAGEDSFTYTIQDPNDGEVTGNVTVNVHEPDLDRGLVAWWTLDTDSNDTSVEGQDNSAANFGSPEFHVYGQVGGAMRMDGENDEFIVNDSPDINFGIHRRKTVSLWFNADDATSGRQVLYREGDVLRGWVFYLDAGYVHMGVWNNVEWESHWAGTYFSAPVTSGQWHHVALALDGIDVVTSDSLSAWFDGSLLGRGDASQSWEHYGGTFLGYTPNTLPYHDGEAEGSNRYTGMLDDVRVYNRTLSDGEIQSLAELIGNRKPMLLMSPVDLPDALPSTQYSANLEAYAMDPDEDPLTFTKMSGPDWIEVAPDGQVSGVPNTADKGLINLEVAIDDGEWEADSYLEINIQVGERRNAARSGWIMYE